MFFIPSLGYDIMQIHRITTPLRGKELHARLDGMDSVAVSSRAVGSVEEIMLAHHLAAAAFGKGEGIAKKLRYEFLLWLSGKRDIRSAMDATAPDGGEMIVVSFCGAADVAGSLSGRELPLGLPEEGDPLALERISLSRVRACCSLYLEYGAEVVPRREVR